jgi:hypothetical protein
MVNPLLKNNRHNFFTHRQRYPLQIYNSFMDMSGKRDLTSDGFSLGLSPDGTIYAAGNDSDHQVSGKPAGTGFIAIGAGESTAVAINDTGTIVLWGRSLPGTPTPTGPGFTDIALGPDWGFAIKEAGPKLTVTGPLSPGQPVDCVEQSRIGAENLIIPYGSTIEHTDHDVTRIIRPDGSEVGWANDQEAEEIWMPGRGNITATWVHMDIPNGSLINQLDEKTTKTTDANGNPVLTVIDLKGGNSNPAHINKAQQRASNSDAATVQHEERNVKIVPKTGIAPGWIEWASQRYTSSTSNFFKRYKAEWKVPAEPADRSKESPTLSQNTEMTIFTSVESYDSNGNSGGIFQPILTWNWIYGGNVGYYRDQWSAAICDHNNAKGTAYSSKILTGINKDDIVEGKIEYDNKNGKWTSTITIKDKNWPYNVKDFATLERQYADFEPGNVDLETVVEAYLLANGFTGLSSTHESKYMFSNVKFENIEIKDQSNNDIAKNFWPYMNEEWEDYRSGNHTKPIQCPNLNVKIVQGWLNYDIILKTTSTNDLQDKESMNSLSNATIIQTAGYAEKKS